MSIKSNFAALTDKFIIFAWNFDWKVYQNKLSVIKYLLDLNVCFDFD